MSVQQLLRHGHGRALLASCAGREPLRGAAVQHPVGRVEPLQPDAAHLLVLVRVAGFTVADLKLGREAAERVQLLRLGLFVQLHVAAGGRLVVRAHGLGRGWRRDHCRCLDLLLLAHGKIGRVEALAGHNAAVQKRRSHGRRLHGLLLLVGRRRRDGRWGGGHDARAGVTVRADAALASAC